MEEGLELEMEPRRGGEQVWATGTAVGRGPTGSHGLGTKRNDGHRDGGPTSR